MKKNDNLPARQEAYRTGYGEGYKRGFNDAIEEMLELIKAYQKAKEFKK